MTDTAIGGRMAGNGRLTREVPMRFTTDDGDFGVVLSAANGDRLFRFQLVVAGQAVGDDQGCLPWGGIAYLCDGETALPRQDAPGLDPSAHTAEEIYRTLRADDALNDKSLAFQHMAESLDDWTVRGYRFRDDIVVIARRRRARRWLMSTTSFTTFTTLMRAVAYHLEVAGFRPVPSQDALPTTAFWRLRSLAFVADDNEVYLTVEGENYAARTWRFTIDSQGGATVTSGPDDFTSGYRRVPGPSLPMWPESLAMAAHLARKHPLPAGPALAALVADARNRLERDV